MFLIGSIVKACNPPEQAQAEAEVAQPEMLPAASEVRERATPSQRDEYIAALPTQADETLPNNLDALGTVLATETTKNPAADPLDAIIDTEDDEFDIDDFIAKVQGISKD